MMARRDGPKGKDGEERAHTHTHTHAHTNEVETEREANEWRDTEREREGQWVVHQTLLWEKGGQLLG